MFYWFNLIIFSILKCTLYAVNNLSNVIYCEYKTWLSRHVCCLLSKRDVFCGLCSLTGLNALSSSICKRQDLDLDKNGGSAHPMVLFRQRNPPLSIYTYVLRAHMCIYTQIPLLLLFLPTHTHTHTHTAKGSPHQHIR